MSSEEVDLLIEYSRFLTPHNFIFFYFFVSNVHLYLALWLGLVCRKCVILVGVRSKCLSC